MKEGHHPLLRVRDWDANHENNRSRELKRLQWVSVQNDLSADSYLDLVSSPDGPAHLGVWMALLMVASRATPRGYLVQANGQSHTAESLSRLTRLSQDIVSGAIERLLSISLLEISERKSRKRNKLTPHPGAGNTQDAAAKPQESALEGKGIEHHHQEENRKKRNGTQRAGDEITTDRSRTSSDAQILLRTVDDEKNPADGYASPEDELKAIYHAKAGAAITIAVLSTIRENLELTGVGMGEFVAALKESHVQNEWRSPAGFLINFARHFRTKTRVASPPVTASEAHDRDYQCQVCHSRIPGEGLVLGDDRNPKPCVCATPHFIARLRHRGILAPETAQ